MLRRSPSDRPFGHSGPRRINLAPRKLGGKQGHKVLSKPTSCVTSAADGTVGSIFTPSSFQIIYPQGSMQLRALPNGDSLLNVTVEPGKCATDPSNVTAVIGAVVEVRLDARGRQVGGDHAFEFSKDRNALLCLTSAVRNQMKSFASVARVSINSGSTMLLPVAPAKGGQISTNDAGDCALAMATAALALAELDAAYADPDLWPAVPALERSYMAAATAATVACANENRAPPGGN